jgi:hypothetical protein
MDKWWDAGVSVANEIVEWERWSIESISHRSRSASEDVEILVIRAADGATSGHSIGDPVQLRAIFLDEANKAVMKAMVYGIVDGEGRVILGVRSPVSAWHHLRLVGGKGHELPVIDAEGL